MRILRLQWYRKRANLLSSLTLCLFAGLLAIALLCHSVVPANVHDEGLACHHTTWLLAPSPILTLLVLLSWLPYITRRRLLQAYPFAVFRPPRALPQSPLDHVISIRMMALCDGFGNMHAYNAVLFYLRRQPCESR